MSPVAANDDGGIPSHVETFKTELRQESTPAKMAAPSTSQNNNAIAIRKVS